MLEGGIIVIIVFLFGRMARRKGYNRGFFIGLTIGVYLTLEFLVLFMFILGSGGNLEEQLLPAALAAVAAGLCGVGIMALILNLLPDKQPAPQPTVPRDPWTCTVCGRINQWDAKQCAFCQTAK